VDQLSPALQNPDGYHVAWASAEKKGYSGVATFSAEKPLKVTQGFGESRFDKEGRVLITEYPEFTLLNIYFPNGKKDDERLRYKMDFYDCTLKYCKNLKKKGKKLIVCGDYNTAHMPIDLERPKENEDTSGFLPIERKWIDSFVANGYIDTLRAFNKEARQYTWWDFKTRARERNVGWRIDYHFVSDSLRSNLKEAFIMPQVYGSDHCPVGITLAF
jgi:exodeoxyribonuclease III